MLRKLCLPLTAEPTLALRRAPSNLSMNPNYCQNKFENNLNNFRGEVEVKLGSFIKDLES